MQTNTNPMALLKKDKATGSPTETHYLLHAAFFFFCLRWSDAHCCSTAPTEIKSGVHSSVGTFPLSSWAVALQWIQPGINKMAPDLTPVKSLVSFGFMALPRAELTYHLTTQNSVQGWSSLIAQTKSKIHSINNRINDHTAEFKNKLLVIRERQWCVVCDPKTIKAGNLICNKMLWYKWTMDIHVTSDVRLERVSKSEEMHTRILVFLHKILRIACNFDKTGPKELQM